MTPALSIPPANLQKDGEGSLPEELQWAWTPSRLLDEPDLVRLLSELITPEDLHRVSHLLAEHGVFLVNTRHSRRDTIQMLARLVRTRQLTLWQRRVSDLVLAIQRRKRVTTQEMQARTAALTTPSRLRGRQEEAQQALPQTPVESMVDGVDQAAQAATLKQAAMSGMPFCEICGQQ